MSPRAMPRKFNRVTERHRACQPDGHNNDKDNNVVSDRVCIITAGNGNKAMKAPVGGCPRQWRQNGGRHLPPGRTRVTRVRSGYRRFRTRSLTCFWRKPRSIGIGRFYPNKITRYAGLRLQIAIGWLYGFL